MKEICQKSNTFLGSIMPVSNKLHNVWCEVDCLSSLSNVPAMKFKKNSVHNFSIAGIFYTLSGWGFEHVKVLLTGQLSLRHDQSSLS